MVRARQQKRCSRNIRSVIENEDGGSALEEDRSCGGKIGVSGGT